MVSTWYSCVFRAALHDFCKRGRLLPANHPACARYSESFHVCFCPFLFLYLLLTTARKFPVTWSSEGKVRVKVPMPTGPGCMRTETKVEPPGRLIGPGVATTQVNVVS